MIPGLKPIPLKELRAQSGPRVWKLKGYLEDFPTLAPIRGLVTAEHLGNMLSVKGDIQTIISLECDRCLISFNQNLDCLQEELIWLGKEIPKENNFKGNLLLEDLMESLDPLGIFDPERWVFEQLSLQIPLHKNCGLECQVYKNDLQPVQKNSNRLDPRLTDLKKLLEP